MKYPPDFNLACSFRRDTYTLIYCKDMDLKTHTRNILFVQYLKSVYENKAFIIGYDEIEKKYMKYRINIC